MLTANALKSVQGRKDALKAAMRLKAAVKTLEALETGGGGGEPAAVTTVSTFTIPVDNPIVAHTGYPLKETKSEGTEVALSAGPAAETPEENSILIKCQVSTGIEGSAQARTLTGHVRVAAFFSRQSAWPAGCVFSARPSPSIYSIQGQSRDSSGL